jgi:hypothetical protein
MPDIFFKAPWGNTLVAVTMLASALLLGISWVGVLTGPREQASWWLLRVALPLLIWAIAGLFAIRGYVLRDHTLTIRRLLWNTKIGLHDLQSADYRPNAMRHSLRLWGNGGLFSFTGKFWNRELGSYQAFVTDLEHTVVLTFPDRKIVLSPENTGEFVDSVLQRRTDV